MPSRDVIDIYAGDSVSKTVSSSVPVSGKTVRMQVRPYPQSDVVVFELPVVSKSADDSVTWSLSSLATSAMCTYESVIDEYVADIQVGDGVASNTTIKGYLFKVHPDVTRGSLGPQDPAVLRKEIVDIQTKLSAVAAKVAAIKVNFAGIFQTVQNLKDAIGQPSPEQQAIVLQPSESYYHVVGGKWVELAPVGSIHPGYIGAYDTISDLNIAVPSPKDDSLAIIGGADFYYYTGGKWVPLSHDDVNALNARVTKNEGDIKAIKANDGQAITHVSMSGNVITFTHADGAKHAVQLPQPHSAPSPSVPKSIIDQINDLETKMASTGTDVTALKQSLGELKHRVDELQSVFSYRGATSPQYPTDPKGAYFLNLSGSVGQTLAVSMPDQSLPDGTTFFVNNENAATQVTVTPKSGESVEQATSIAVPAKSVLLLVKNGTNWIRNYAGYIPSSLQDLINRVANQLTPELHTQDQIVKMINNWLANPTTKGKLDEIMKGLGYEKKTQPQPHPSAIQVYVGKSDDYPTSFARENGPYAPHQNLVAQGMDVTPSKVWIAVPESSATKVTGIVANGGLPARWDSQTKTINGKQWRIWLSPYQFHAQHIDFTLNWSI
ncbi:hypothetical protein DMW20_12055 [Vibrio parahaemolyticus]|nr:hypothetical protein [Vibrio parahaemolyticus]